MLLAHGIGNEIRVLDGIGASIWVLPIAGIIDTRRPATDVLGPAGSLEYLLNVLDSHATTPSPLRRQ